MSELFKLPAHLLDGPSPSENPFIENVSMKEVMTGQHLKAHVLIQIFDPDMSAPTPAYKGFEETHQFAFLDIEEEGPLAPTKDHAEDIVRILKDALLRKKSVIVHCVAGICRSGAVAEVGVILGFEDSERFRVPNLLLKKHLMNAAGLGYGYEE